MSFSSPHDKKVLFIGKKVHGRTVDIKADPFFLDANILDPPP